MSVKLIFFNTKYVFSKVVISYSVSESSNDMTMLPSKKNPTCINVYHVITKYVSKAVSLNPNHYSIP